MINVLILLKPSLLKFVVFYFFFQILTLKFMISFATMVVLVMVGQRGSQFAVNLYVGPAGGLGHVSEMYGICVKI